MTYGAETDLFSGEGYSSEDVLLPGIIFSRRILSVLGVEFDHGVFYRSDRRHCPAVIFCFLLGRAGFTRFAQVLWNYFAWLSP